MLHDGSKLQRIERILSNRGLGSRSEVSKWFRRGVVKIDDKTIRSGASRFAEDTLIHVEGKPSYGTPLLAVYNKPVGVHCTMKDSWNRECLENLHVEHPFLKFMHPVGRLDADTSGLLLFCRDGDLTHILLHPKGGVEREYESVVVGTVDYESLRNVLAAGVETTDGTFSAELLEAKVLDNVEERHLLPQYLALSVQPNITAPGADNFEEENESGHSSVTEDDVATSYLRLKVAEGKYRMVRRILHNAGHSVLRLNRRRYGEIVLSISDEDELPQRSVRIATDEEVQWAMNLFKSKKAAVLSATEAIAKSKKAKVKKETSTVKSKNEINRIIGSK